MELFAGLEPNRFPGSDADLGSGAWVPANAGLACTHAEDPKAAQFDALTGRQGLLESFKDSVHRSLCLGAGQPCALDDVMNDVLLNQSGYLSGDSKRLYHALLN